MTVLAVLLINHSAVSVRPGSTLAEALPAMWPAAGACAVGFLALLSCWFLHHLQFHYLTRSSGGLLLAHALLLPAVLLVPFSTALLNTLALRSQALLPFEANELLLQVLLLLTWRHAVKGGLLFGSDVPSQVVRRLRLMLRAGSITMLVIVGLAFVSAPVSLGALIALLGTQIALVAKGGYTLDLRASPERITTA
jgi:uncharacterized membrane protein